MDRLAQSQILGGMRYCDCLEDDVSSVNSDARGTASTTRRRTR